jgi:hypothetical protein
LETYPSESDEDEPSKVIGIPISGRSVEIVNFAIGEAFIGSGLDSGSHPPNNRGTKTNRNLRKHLIKVSKDFR